MNKTNLTALLKAIRAMIMRERVAYRDYLGEETVTRLLVSGTLSEDGYLTLEDPTFAGFVAGETYQVTIDGETTDCVAVLMGDAASVFVGEFNSDNFAAAGVFNGNALCISVGEYVGKPITVSQTKTTKKYRTKKLPKELLPDGLATSADVSKVASAVKTAQLDAYDALDLANTAQNTAEAAQNTAEAAQNTANTAKSTAEAAKSTAESLSAEVTRCANGLFVKPGGNITGANYNNFVVLHAGNRDDAVSGGNFSGIKLYVTDKSLGGVYASALIYIQPPSTMDDFPMIRFSATAKHSIRSLTGVELAGISAITLNSSTPNSTKKFRITVNDSGTLSAVEVTDAS